MRKKRTLARLLAVLLALTFLFTGGVPVAQGAETYSGVSYYDSLLKNASYQDVSGHWAPALHIPVTALGSCAEGRIFGRTAPPAEDVLGMLLRLADLKERPRESMLIPSRKRNT